MVVSIFNYIIKNFTNFYVNAGKSFIKKVQGNECNNLPKITDVQDLFLSSVSWPF